MCGVKKRVERSSADPAVVVTTYEGQHTHACPVGPRGGGSLTWQNQSFHSSPSLSPLAEMPSLSFRASHGQQMLQSSEGAFFHGGGVAEQPPLLDSISGDGVYGLGQSYSDDISARDYGLLQDLVPHEYSRKG